MRAREQFTYAPLFPGQIRLLNISDARHLRGNFVCELKVFNPENRPKYDALSYAWGTQKASKKIICNNAIMQLTPHLLEGIRSVSRHIRTDWLWIDAICINQCDDEEKASQVMQMDLIYSASERTIVWMGIIPALNLTGLRVAGNLCEKLDKYLAPNEWKIETILSFSQSHRIYIDTFEAIFSPSWFTRLWVLQEIFLPPSVVALYEVGRVDFFKLVRLGLALSVSRLLDTGSRAETGVEACSYFNTLHQQTRYDSADDAIPQILLTAQTKETTEPIDRIYALLGLLPRGMRKYIVIDYSANSRAEYWKAYIGAFRYWLPHYGENCLKVLSHSCRSPVLPSWCPDLNAKSHITGLTNAGSGAGFVSDQEVNDSLRFSSGTLTLGLDAFAGGRVEIFLPFDSPVTTDFYVVAESLFTYVVACQRLVATKGKEISLEGFANVLVGGKIVREARHTLRGAEARLEECLAAWNEAQFTEEQKYEILSEEHKYVFMQSIFRACNGRAFFLTSTHMGIGPMDLQKGDIIHVIKGFHMPYALRPIKNPEEGQRKRYQILGECYVHGIMDGEILKSEDFGNWGWSRLDIV